jgi:hypothetical protein
MPSTSLLSVFVSTTWMLALAVLVLIVVVNACVCCLVQALLIGTSLTRPPRPRRIADAIADTAVPGPDDFVSLHVAIHNEPW